MREPPLTRHDGESWRDQLSRVRLMSKGDPTWDLSDNDIAALKAVLANRNALLEALKDMTDDLEARWDMRDPSTNPGIVQNVRRAKAVIAASEVGVSRAGAEP